MRRVGALPTTGDNAAGMLHIPHAIKQRENEMQVRNKRGATHTITVIMCILAAACSEEAMESLKRPPDFSTRDSMGVTVIENHPVDARFMQTWSIDTNPAAVVASPQGDTAAALHEVRAITHLPNDMFAVVNGGRGVFAEVRFYDATGKLVATHGREGDAAGEFKLITGLAAAGGDTVVVVDDAKQTVSWVSAAVGHVRSEPLPAQAIRRLTAGKSTDVVPLGDSVFAVTSTFQGEKAEAHAFRIVDAARQTAVDLASYDVQPLKEVATASGPIFIQAQIEPGAPIHAVGAGINRMCAANTRIPKVICAQPDGRRTALHWPTDTIPFTDRDREQLESQMRKMFGESADAAAKARSDAIVAAHEYPQHYNLINWIQFDVDGNLWVNEKARTRSGQRYTRFRVFDADGRQIAFADGFLSSTREPASIGQTSVVRALRTESGTRLAIYRIEKKGVR